jgi:transposase
VLRSGASGARPTPWTPTARPARLLSGEADTDPKRASIEPLRALNVARRSAVKAQQAAWRQIGTMLVNASSPLRDRLRGLSKAALLTTLAAARPGQVSDPDDADTLFALRTLARRHHHLTDEITAITERLRVRAATANPALMAIKGVGPVVGAQLLITAGDNPDRLRSSASFAALCGTAPIPVSSGRTDRYRLSRGGDRAANPALHHIVTVRMTYDPATRAYRDQRLARGWTTKAVQRALKRCRPRSVPSPRRPLRRPRLSRPATRPASQEHHPQPGRPPLRGLAHAHLHHRTRHPPRRHPRCRLPRLAPSRLTTNRSISGPQALKHKSRLPPDRVAYG